MAGYINSSAIIKPNEVFNGRQAQLWLDGDYINEIMSFEATLKANKTTLAFAGVMTNSAVPTSYDGTGNAKIHKKNSKFLKLMAEAYKNGEWPLFTFISKIYNPNSGGKTERVEITGVSFDNIVLANWSVEQHISIDLPFTFDGFNILESC